MGVKDLESFYEEEMGINPGLASVIGPIEKVHEGEVLFARRSGIPITSADYSSSNVIIKMSNTNTRNFKKNQTETIRAREATTFSEVIRDVLKVSHRDLPQELLDYMMSTVVIEFPNFLDLHRQKTDELGEFLSEKTKKYDNSDLLRGMDAFAEATWDHHDTIYDFTIIEPSRKFARWLISLEQENLE